MLVKAVIPVAGIGTRFLPATKAQPKEMLTVLNKPVIQYVVEEAMSAGINDILMITGKDKYSIENHFDRSPELEAYLEKKGDFKRLEMIRNISNGADLHYIRQKEPKGLGHAILCARNHVGDEPFMVLLGDNIFKSNTSLSCAQQMLAVYEKFKAPIIAMEIIPDDEVSRYGIVECKSTDDPRIFEITNLMEKPQPSETKSRTAISGAYIITPEIFKMIEDTPPGKGGEIQLTDALKALLKERKMYAIIFDGRRYDIGTVLDYAKTSIDFALMDESIRDEVIEHIRNTGIV